MIRRITLPSGLICGLTTPKIPLLQNYYVLFIENGKHSNRHQELLTIAAHRIARALARHKFKDPECYSLIYNAGKTRRKQHPHIHILLAPSVAGKRASFFYYCIKHILRKLRAPVKLLEW